MQASTMWLFLLNKYWDIFVMYTYMNFISTIREANNISQ